jgi:hypothetical protein
MMRLSQMPRLAALVDPWRDASVPEVAVVAAIQVTVLRFPRTEDDRRDATTVMSFPLPPSTRRSAAWPTELLAAALTLPTDSLKGGFYLVVGELVGVFHQFPIQDGYTCLVWLRWGR